jgi:hypothetical protein
LPDVCVLYGDECIRTCDERGGVTMCDRQSFRKADPPLWPEEVKNEEKKNPKKHSTGTEFQEDYIR